MAHHVINERYGDAMVCTDCWDLAHHGFESDEPTDCEPLCKLAGFEVTDNTNADDPDDDGIEQFSKDECEGCGSHLAGQRYRMGVSEMAVTQSQPPIVLQTARKGDLIVYAVSHRVSYVRGPATTHTEYRVGIVGSVNRAGVVTTIRETWRGKLDTDAKKVDRIGSLHPDKRIVPAAQVATDELFSDLEVACEARWDADRWPTLDDVREYVMRYRRG